MDIGFGASPGSQDGYDGQTPVDLTGKVGEAIGFYRERSDDWAGDTGFYQLDFESPLAPGESKTWWNIYAWSQNYDVPGGYEDVIIDHGAPHGYTAQLVLDYVPESLGYTGPTVFDINLNKGKIVYLPFPTVDNPLDGVKMHLTVTSPVPEPSSFLALAGIAPLIGFALRRRR